MDIVCELPFEAYLIVNPNTFPKKINLGPWTVSQLPNEAEKNCAKVEENDELDLYFNCADSTAKLYFDALECCPITTRIVVDNNGLVYCTPKEEFVSIYRSDSNYDALRVDTLQLSIVCDSKVYISYLNVSPKQLVLREWEMMRDDLESEIRGLSQDIVRRNIGIGSEIVGVLPPDDLYAFLVINKNSQAIMSALLDIKGKPKYKIQKNYEESDQSKNREIDSETIKRFLHRGAQSNKLIVPRRDIVYDIQENRLLKIIVKTYDEKIVRFIAVINASLAYRKQHIKKTLKQNLYDEKYIEGLKKYLETSEKLKKITNVVKNASWFKEVSYPKDMNIPHSFAIDSRYGTLYRMYIEINKREFSVHLDPQYSYSWKKSSVLYEMWCYICVSRFFLHRYSLLSSKFESIFDDGFLFPFLESGTKITVEDEKSIVEIVYDTMLPKKSQQVNLFDNPLYLTGTHTRPDICINMYSKKSGWYIGSFVIECKYRKLMSFWNGTTRSSKPQITAYHNDSKSPLFLGGYLSFTSSRPVHQVLVFTPNIFTKKEYYDDNVILLTFKPTEKRENVESVCEDLLNMVGDKINQADSFYDQIQVNN